MKDPKAGTALRVEDVDLILESVNARQKIWANEPIDMSLKVVLFNIGDRFAEVACVGGEWSGTKTTFPPGQTGVPKCPNGHVCVQGKGLRLGWLDA